jgi:hypothetical protein
MVGGARHDGVNARELRKSDEGRRARAKRQDRGIGDVAP